MISRFALCVCVMIAVVSAGSTSSADVLRDPGVDEVFEQANFRLAPRGNYEGAFRIVDEGTGDVIGYAPWDPQNRRWTLFTLRSDYRGFLQATLGDPSPPHYTQYLYYDRDNRYLGVFIADLGGRPATPDLPYGELGGSLNFYAIGLRPIEMPRLEPETEPLRRFPPGVDIGPVPVPSLK